METVERTYRGKTYKYAFRDGVIKHDYYKDRLVDNLHGLMEVILQARGKIEVLDMATGNGYTAIILADYYRDAIKRLVAYDINPEAVDLAQHNAGHNNCADNIDFRVGSLYEPLHECEKFNLIVSALPPVPISPEEMAKLPGTTRAHHWIESTAGPTGRTLLDGMIEGASKHLHEKGYVITAQADFQNATKHTLDVMREHGLVGQFLGGPWKKKLHKDMLTVLRRKHIEHLGYTFHQDEDGDDYFTVEVYSGRRL